jgi:mRNA interferase MazF
MTFMSSGSLPANPQRGEVWWVNFHPQKGHEVRKVRPALVVGEPMLGNLMLRIVAPVFTDRGHHRMLPWFVALPKSAANGLDRDGEMDASQIKSLSVDRFSEKTGVVTPSQLNNVLDAIVLCLGYEPPGIAE